MKGGLFDVLHVTVCQMNMELDFWKMGLAEKETFVNFLLDASWNERFLSSFICKTFHSSFSIYSKILFFRLVNRTESSVFLEVHVYSEKKTSFF